MGTHSLTGFPDPAVAGAVQEAVDRLRSQLRDSGPAIAESLEEWVVTVYGERGLAGAFLADTSYPVVHLPYWAVPTLDDATITNLAQSSIAGYLWIRLIDNVMDADGTRQEIGLLPALAALHLGFLAPYQHHFEEGHPFWATLRSAWTESAEAAHVDHHLQISDLSTFRKVTSRKTRAAIIPVAAALHLSGDEVKIDDWSTMVDAFGRWHQFQNDLFDWRKDLSHANPTWLLVEGERAGSGHSDLERWFWDSGFEWAATTLKAFQGEVQQAAETLENDRLDDYLSWRFTEISERLDYIRQGMSEAARLASLFDTDN